MAVLNRILHTLRVRYTLDMIYTYSGNILIAVHPSIITPLCHLVFGLETCNYYYCYYYYVVWCFGNEGGYSPGLADVCLGWSFLLTSFSLRGAVHVLGTGLGGIVHPRAQRWGGGGGC